MSRSTSLGPQDQPLQLHCLVLNNLIINNRQGTINKSIYKKVTIKLTRKHQNNAHTLLHLYVMNASN